MTENDVLLPCWRCKAKDAQLHLKGKKYFLACPRCLTISPLFTSPLAAAKSWNDMYLKHRKVKEKTAENLMDQIEKSKSRPLENVITALGIPGVGKSVAGLLVERFGSFDALRSAL